MRLIFVIPLFAVVLFLVYQAGRMHCTYRRLRSGGESEAVSGSRNQN